MLRPKFEGIPEELKERRQWVLWKLVVRAGKETKIPWSVYDKAASSTDRSTWHEFECVVMRYEEQRHAGIGFVFAEDDGLVGVDLDSCRNPETGEVSQWAKKWIQRSATYTEISPSETGVKMWLRSDMRLDKGRNIKIDELGTDPKKKPGVEIYSHGRYFAVTGHVLRGFAA